MSLENEICAQREVHLYRKYHPARAFHDPGTRELCDEKQRKNKKAPKYYLRGFKAGNGNRTHLSTLGRSCSTDELYLHFEQSYCITFDEISQLRFQGFLYIAISSRTPRRSCRDVRGALAPSTAHICDPPEAFILHREIVLKMKASFILRAYLMSKDTSIAR